MEKIMNLSYSSAILNLTEVNPSFDLGTLRIAYTGKNRNCSFISKESFERAIPSMFGCPVVANYIREKDEIGSHDGEFVTKDNGDIEYVNLTQPVGFVPPGAKYSWEVVDDNGQIHQYLTTEVLLWKRQEAYEKIKENGITDQSMEITVTDGEMKDDYYNIEDFYFTAFCLLGTAEPCFESAALLSFAKNDIKEELSEMYAEFKLAFANDERFMAKEGEEKNMDKLKELLEKYSVIAEELSFEVEGLSDEELETAFKEAYEQDPEPEIEPEIDPEEPVEPEDTFALSGQIREALHTAVCEAETIESEWGNYPRYWLVDFDEAASEVYYEDCNDWNIYGAPYTMNGDNVVVDFKKCKRKKYAIVDFDEGEETFSLKGCVEAVVNAYKAKSDATYSALEEKYNTLVSDDNKRQAAEIFGRFEEKLGGDAEFEAMKNATSFDIAELENKLYALIGRKQFKLNTKAPQKSPKAPIVTGEPPVQSPYGDLFDFMKKK